jgi:hypothetical protein
VFKLRFPPTEIPRWASRYSFPGEDELADRVAPAARDRGYLKRPEFLSLCKWKTPRTAKRCALNSSDQIRDATQLSFGTADERAKIGILRLLDGVDWPTASVLLHFCDRQPYPVLDFRALWSLGIPSPPAYTFEFWWAYATFTRQMADSSGESMRTVDRALWQYSKEHQPARRLTSA